MNQASYAAKPGKRLWAGGFDVLTCLVLFLVIGVVGERVGVSTVHWSAFGILYWAYHFGCLVAREGRTLGKTAVDICVISVAGRPLSVSQSLIRSGTRSWPFFLIDANIAEFFIDVHMADQLVGSLSLLALLIAELTLISRSVTGQTLADRFAHSVVVNLPPLQPHRAPAGPMYSAEDKEFGFPPSRPSGGQEDWRKRSNFSSSGRDVSATGADGRRST